MKIRKAAIKDFETVKELAGEIGEEISTCYFRRLLKNICLVAEEDGIIVGVIYGECNKNEKWTYLSGVVVLQDFRNKGIGGKLIKEFEKRATGSIEVFAKEDTLAKILPKLGYERRGRYINFTKRYVKS